MEEILKTNSNERKEHFKQLRVLQKLQSKQLRRHLLIFGF